MLLSNISKEISQSLNSMLASSMIASTCLSCVAGSENSQSCFGACVQSSFFTKCTLIIIIIIIIIIILTYLIRVNPSANAVIKGCPEQLKIELRLHLRLHLGAGNIVQV